MGLFKRKKGKDKDTEEQAEGPKKSKKKLLFILIPVVLVVCAAGGAGAYFILSGRSPEFYWDEKEKIASVTEIVGKRRCKTEETKKAVTYTYKGGKSNKKDVEKYVEYLTQKKEFADIEIPDFEKLEKEEKKDDEKADDKEKKKKHFELGADSKKEGKLLKAVINVKGDSYTIKVQTKKGTLAEQLEKIEEARAEQEGAHDFIEAVEAVQGLSAEKLGVSAPSDQLEYVPGPGRTEVDGKNYYKVMVYTKGPGGANNYQGSYLVDCMFVSDFYQYNEETGECTPLEENTAKVKASKE